MQDIFSAVRMCYGPDGLGSISRACDKKNKKGRLPIKEGDVVLIQSEKCTRGKWKLGIVLKLIKGRDGVVRAARLRAGKSYLERAIQQLCPVKLSCDRIQEPQVPVLNPTARVFTPRRAVVAATERIKAIADQEEQQN